MTRKGEPLDPQHVLLELDGPGVSPQSVDAPAFLRLASAFFRLLKGNATASQRQLSLSSLEVIDKCVALSVGSDNPEGARVCAVEALRQIGGEDPPRGLQQLAEEARASVRELPEGQRAKVIIGPWSHAVPAPPPAPASPLDSLLSIRAVPLRAGGKRPAVRFMSQFEEDFTLFVTEDQARTLGSLLYNEVEIEAVISRDPAGRIVEVAAEQRADVGEDLL